MEQYAEVVLDLEGNAVKGASVQVLTPGGAPVKVYDAAGAEQANPIVTGAQGDFAFQVPNGKYLLRVAIAGTVYKTIGPLTFYDPDDDTGRLDQNALAAKLDTTTFNVAVAAIQAQLAPTFRGDTGVKYAVQAYVIRNDGSGWKYIDDIDHRPLNMSAVSVVGDVLRVTYEEQGKRVLTHAVLTDETMSALGMTCGPSVGLAYSDIRMYIPFACWVEYIAGAWRFGSDDGINPWLGPGADTTITTSDGGATFTINHKIASGSHPPTMSVLTQATGDAPGTDLRLSYGGLEVKGTAHALFEGYIGWAGPGPNDWTVITPNIAKPTFAFAAGVLTVTHENLGPETKSVSVDSVSGVYTPASGTVVAGNSFQVVFQDWAGANVATPNANMKFRYMRPRNVKSNPPAGMRVAIQRGPVLLDPAKVVSTNGNLWGFGVIEME